MDSSRAFPLETTQPSDTAGVSRRHLGCAALGCAALPLMAACGSEEEDPSGSSTEEQPTDGGEGSPTAEAGAALVAVADVPLGGGVILADAEVVVTQPAEGDFKGYTVTCTHQGCAVTKVENGTIQCPCHGSAFAIDDGAVVNGPASSPLPTVEIAVEGDQVVRA